MNREFMKMSKLMDKIVKMHIHITINKAYFTQLYSLTDSSYDESFFSDALSLSFSFNHENTKKDIDIVTLFLY